VHNNIIVNLCEPAASSLLKAQAGASSFSSGGVLWVAELPLGGSTAMAHCNGGFLLQVQGQQQ